MIFEIHIDGHPSYRKTVEGNLCVIGRSKKCDLPIKYEGLSRKHFTVEYDGKNFFITDHSSTNGISVNGEKIKPETKTSYYNFFPIKVGPKLSITVFPDGHSFEEFGKPLDKLESLPAAKARSDEKKTEKKKFNTLIPVALAMVFGVTGYIVFKMNQDDNVVEIDVAPTIIKKVEEKHVYIVKPNVPALDFLALKNSGLCSGAETEKLCKKFFPENGAEGVKASKEGLVFFLDIQKRLEVLDKNQAYKGLTSDLKEELALAYLIMEAKLFLKKDNQNFYAVAFKTENERPVLTSFAAYKADPKFKIKDEELSIIMSYSLFMGQTKFYQDHVSSFIAWQRL